MYMYMHMNICICKCVYIDRCMCVRKVPPDLSAHGATGPEIMFRLARKAGKG